MDLAALASCLSSPACIVTQSTGGLIIGMLLFLVAAGLTLIFGVLKVVNFAHGSFYMLGAYFALTIFQLTGSYTLTILGAGAATALVGLVFERLFISRVYGQNVLMQLLVCYGFVLIFDDVVKIVWGPEFKSMGMPPAFQMPPLFIAGGVVPPFYLFLIGIGVRRSGWRSWLLIDRRGSARPSAPPRINPSMVAALGINTGFLYGLVFALGGLLAGFAGALAAPVRSLTPGHGFLDPDRVLHRHRHRRHGLDRRRIRRLARDRPHPLLRQPRLSPVHRRADVSVHGDRPDRQADRPVRQGDRLTMRETLARIRSR